MGTSFIEIQVGVRGSIVGTSVISGHLQHTRIRRMEPCLKTFHLGDQLELQRHHKDEPDQYGQSLEAGLRKFDHDA